MSVHLRSDGTASNKIFIGTTGLPSSTSIQTNNFLPVDSFINSPKSSHPPIDSYIEQEEHARNSDKIFSPSFPRKNGQGHKSPKQKGNFSPVNFVENSALPSAPVHLQEMVDNLLTNNMNPEYQQQVYPNSQQQPPPSNFNSLPLFTNVSNTQDFVVPDTSPIVGVSKSGDPHTTPVPQKIIPLPDHKSFIQKQQRPYNIRHDSEYPSGQLNNVIYDMVYQQQQPDIERQPQVDYSQPSRSMLCPLRYHQQTVDYSIPGHQQQNPYYVPLSAYNSQSMLVFQLDCPPSQQQPSLTPTSSIPSQNFHQHGSISPNPSPQVFDNGIWDNYPRICSKPFASHHVSNECTGIFPKNPAVQPSINPASHKDNTTHHPDTVGGRKRRRRTTPKELLILENHLKINSLPDFAQREQLARETGMTPRSVQIWFQNRRQSLKKKKAISANSYPLDNSSGSTNYTLRNLYYSNQTSHPAPSPLVQPPRISIPQPDDPQPPQSLLSSSVQDHLRDEHTKHLPLISPPLAPNNNSDVPHLQFSSSIQPSNIQLNHDASASTTTPPPLSTTTTTTTTTTTPSSSSAFCNTSYYKDKNLISHNNPRSYSYPQNVQDEQKQPFDVVSTNDLVDGNYNNLFPNHKDNKNSPSKNGIHPNSNYTPSPNRIYHPVYPTSPPPPSSELPSIISSPTTAASHTKIEPRQQLPQTQRSPQSSISSFEQQNYDSNTTPRIINPFHQAHDPMSTLVALAAMTSDQIDKF